MPDIYELHAKAFSHVSAYVVAKDGERVATIAFKFPADGAGRLYAYVHWLGVEMVRGHANGYGYDKRSAAAAVAARKIPATAVKDRAAAIGEPFCEGRPWRIHFDAFRLALIDDNGRSWGRRLEEAGFTVWSAV